MKPLADGVRDGLTGSSPIKKKYGHACPMCRHPKYEKMLIKFDQY